MLIAPEQMIGAVEVMPDSCKDVNPFLCFDVAPEKLGTLEMVVLSSRQVSASWLGPEFLQTSNSTALLALRRQGKQNEVLADPAEWPLTIRLLAHVLLGAQTLRNNKYDMISYSLYYMEHNMIIYIYTV